ncbi:MAG: NAD(P)-dependent oxidoreductase [Dermatophilaceae bacterium]
MHRSTPLGHILVTGGAGFIGCALSQLLASSATSWTVVDNLHPQVHPSGERPAALAPEAALVIADVSDEDTFARLGDLRPDIVIHLAAETGTGQSLHEASRHSLANVVGTTRLTDWLSATGHNPGHILLTSSRAVYGEGQWRERSGRVFYPGQRSHAMMSACQWDFPDAVGLPASAAETQPMPTSVYGATKLAQEHVLSAWTLSHGVPLSIFRLQNVYGPGQSLTNPYTGIVTLFSRLAKAGTSIPVYEDGEIIRDFVFIDDVAAALVAGLRAVPDGVRTLDVGTGMPTSITKLAATMADHHQAPSPHVTGQFRDGDVRHALADVSATRKELGWQSLVDIHEGVARLQEWIDAQENVS